MAGALPDPAIRDHFFVRAKLTAFQINLGQLFGGFESPILLDRRFPRNALGPRDVPTAQHPFLGVFGHMGDLAFKLPRGADINQGLLCLTAGQRVFIKSTDFRIKPLGWNGVRSRRNRHLLPG